MSWLTRGLTSSVGLKFLMALTGTLLVLFVIAHMLGNLQVFLPADAETGVHALNKYAKKLQDLGALLWVARIGLFVVFALHVAVGTLLWLKNRAARPVGYADLQPLKSTIYSRTMIWTGLLVLVFLGYHLLHFTLHVTNPEHVKAVSDTDPHTDVRAMVIAGFQEASIAVPYIIAMLLLGFHLMHGVGSVFQTIGWNPQKFEPFWQGLGKTVAIVLIIGNVAMPLLILLRVVGEGGQ